MLHNYKHSIRQELLYIILSIVMITTSVGYAIFIKAYMDREQKRDISLVKTISQIINQDVAKIIYSNNLSVASDVTAELDSFPHINEVILYKKSGEILFQYSRDNETHKRERFQKDMLKKISIKNGELQLHNKLFYKKTFLAYGTYIFTTEPLLEVLFDNLPFLAFILAIMLFLAYILSKYQADKFTSPIINLVQFLENIKDGSFLRNRITTKEENEFGVLYNEVNTMLQTIEDSLIHDNLTGLFNRSSLLQDMSFLQERASILLLNVDAFKEINDVYGNHFGNRVLIKLAEFLTHYPYEIPKVKIYRVGGDEFAILFRDTSVDTIMQLAESLGEAIRTEHFIVDEIVTNFTVSIAVNTLAPLLENADLALKVVKKDMNKAIIEYKEELGIKKEWKKNIEIIDMVKSALQEDRIVPYFQGIVNLKTMKIEKYEALVRLILPSGKPLSPYAFLETVSKTHYYYDITKVMIRETMKVAKVHPEQRFSINFSMKDIINENITTTLFALFDEDRETAKRVDIELLETELVAVDDSRIHHFISKVHSYGSKLLIDDFGTGYSNFSYLSDLDVDILKIDASITKEIATNPRKLHIAKTIHDFTIGMDMQNVAEFVETKEIAEILQEMGVEYAQGYLFSKPLPAPLKDSNITL